MNIAAQNLPNIGAQQSHNSPNIGKYIPTSYRDNVDNGTFYCNNTSLMADMETERANGIWAGNTKSIKESSISQSGKPITMIVSICMMTIGKQETTGQIFTRWLFAESQSARQGKAGQRTKCR